MEIVNAGGLGLNVVCRGLTLHFTDNNTVLSSLYISFSRGLAEIPQLPVLFVLQLVNSP